MTSVVSPPSPSRIHGWTKRSWENGRWCRCRCITSASNTGTNPLVFDTDGDTIRASDLSDSNEFSARTAPDIADDIPWEHGEVRRRCGADSLDRRQRFPEVHRRDKMLADLLVPLTAQK